MESVSSVEQILHGFDSKLKEMEEALDYVMIDLSEEQVDIENASNSIQQFSKPTKDENMDSGDFLDYLNAEYSTLLQENENLQTLVYDAKNEITMLKNEKDNALSAIDKLQNQLDRSNSQGYRDQMMTSSSFDDSTNRGSESDATIQDLEKVVQSSRGKIEELEFSLATSTINLDEAEREKRKLLDRIKELSAENASAKFMMTEICCTLESTAEKLSPHQTGTVINGDSIAERIRNKIRPKKIDDKDNLLTQIDYADALFTFILTESNKEINILRKTPNSEIGVVQSQIKSMKDIQECTSEKLEILIAEKNKADRTILDLKAQIETLRNSEKSTKKGDNNQQGLACDIRDTHQNINQSEPSSLAVENMKDQQKADLSLNSKTLQPEEAIERIPSDDRVEDNCEDVGDGYSTLIEAEIKGFISSLHEEKDFDSANKTYTIPDFSLPGESIDNDTLVTPGGISALIEAELNETVAYLQYERDSQPAESEFIYPEYEKVTAMKRKVEAWNLDSRHPIDGNHHVANRDDEEMIRRRDHEEIEREEMRDEGMRGEVMPEARDMEFDDEMKDYDFFHQTKIKSVDDDEMHTLQNDSSPICINEQRRDVNMVQDTPERSDFSDTDKMKVTTKKIVTDSRCIVSEFVPVAGLDKVDMTIEKDCQDENDTVKNVVEKEMSESLHQRKVDEGEESESSNLCDSTIMKDMMNESITDSRPEVCESAINIDMLEEVTKDSNVAEDASENSDLANSVRMETREIKSISDSVSDSICNIDKCVSDKAVDNFKVKTEEECKNQNDTKESVFNKEVSNSFERNADEGDEGSKNSDASEKRTMNESISDSKLADDEFATDSIFVKGQEMNFNIARDAADDFATDIENKMNLSTSEASDVDGCASEANLDVNDTIYYDCQDDNDAIESFADEVEEAMLSDEEYETLDFADATIISNESVSDIICDEVSTCALDTNLFKSENPDDANVAKIEEMENESVSRYVVDKFASDKDVDNNNVTIQEEYLNHNDTVEYIVQDSSKKADMSNAIVSKVTASTDLDIDEYPIGDKIDSDKIIIDNNNQDHKDDMNKGMGEVKGTSFSDSEPDADGLINADSNAMEPRHQDVDEKVINNNDASNSIVVEDKNSEDAMGQKDFEDPDELVGETFDDKDQQSEQGSDTCSVSYSTCSDYIYDASIPSDFSSYTDETSCEDLKENDALERDEDKKSVEYGVFDVSEKENSNDVQDDEMDYNLYLDMSDEDGSYSDESDESDEDDIDVEGFLNEEYDFLNEEIIKYENDTRSEYSSEALVCSIDVSENDNLNVSHLDQSPIHGKEIIPKPGLRQQKMSTLQRKIMRYRKAKAKAKSKRSNLKTIPEVPENQSTRRKFFRISKKEKKTKEKKTKEKKTKVKKKKEKKPKRKKRLMRRLANAALTLRLI